MALHPGEFLYLVSRKLVVFKVMQENDFIGVSKDSLLEWKEHIVRICANIAKCIYLLSTV